MRDRGDVAACLNAQECLSSRVSASTGRSSSCRRLRRPTVLRLSGSGPRVSGNRPAGACGSCPSRPPWRNPRPSHRHTTDICQGPSACRRSGGTISRLRSRPFGTGYEWRECLRPGRRSCSLHHHAAHLTPGVSKAPPATAGSSLTRTRHYTIVPKMGRTATNGRVKVPPEPGVVTPLSPDHTVRLIDRTPARYCGLAPAASS